ncbi:Predicted arabinose efflux permease, MFS family [Halobiforma haloterrestris]|uniref:Predicted arabinose efflux permease, MFS family n=1 Tax=Natronobacterium haloterrestre TaxID=148448 RepID=A0A1I1FMH8_NATHA|nr:MFS transporter [Halobiforma haloterrestris]SFB98230.1 Predicted arabinose efflux permease, MFS family [Halobiforma haloterrestris]
MNLPSIESNRVVLAVVASTFFVGFGGGVIFPILPNLGEYLGISAFMVGFILSANRFTRLVANAPAGALVDRIGTRTPFIAGLAIEGLATSMYVVALFSPLPEFWFVVARVLWGLGSALVFATAYTITADVSEADSRGTSMGIVRAGITFGFPAGLVLGGIVSDVWSNGAAFVLAASFAGLASVIAYLIVPETHVEGEQESVKPWDLEISVPAVTVGLVNFGLYFAYIGVLFSTLVLLLDARAVSIFGLDAQGSSGMLMAVTVLTGSVFTLGGGVLSDSVGARVPVLLGFLLTSFVGFVALSVGRSFEVLVLACVLIGAGQGGVGGPLTALLADLTPEDRVGRAMGTNNVLGDVGGGLGPLVSLPLVEAVSFEFVYGVSAALPLLAGVVLVAGIYAHTGRMNPSIGESAG